MANTPYMDAYNAIKNMENGLNGATPLPLPAPTDTIVVGSIDAQTGALTFAVPTFQQTLTETQPPASGPTPSLVKGVDRMANTSTGYPNEPVVHTVGLIATNCVNLILALDVTNVPVVAKTTSAVSHLRVASGATIASAVTAEAGSTGNVTVTGFPSAGTQGSRILLNAGVSASAFYPGTSAEAPGGASPGVETFQLAITVNGNLYFQYIAICRPPVLGLGAFVIPAIPTAIVFAPPQGQLGKNSNSFTDKITITNTTTVSVSTQNSTKQMQAYTIAQLAGDVAGILGQIGTLTSAIEALKTADGKSASTSTVPSGSSGSSQSTAAGNTSSPSGSILDDVLKAYNSSWGLVSAALSGFGNQGTSSETSNISTQTNNSFAIAVTYSDSYGSTAGEGPGEGDRFVYLQNVYAVWANVNGNVSLSILGYDGVAANPASALIADLQALSSGGTAATTGLDSATIELMLGLDPYYVLSKRKVSPVIQPPLIGPPRFTPLSPLNASGSGTSATGDVFSLSNEQITDTSTTTTNQTINVTEYKPGWIDVLLGADNTDTTTTLTATNTLTTDQKSDETITNTVTMYTSSDPSDVYKIQFWFDNLSQTIVPVPADSPVLQGVTIVGATGGTNEPATTAT